MTALAHPRLHHLALTVSDVNASVTWYEDIFGVRFQMDAPHQGGVGKVLADERWELMIVLHHHDANDRNLFGETATGLDHAGFIVPDRSDLEAWQTHLDAKGVVRAGVADKPLTQSPIADETYGSVLVFRDPDNIQSRSSPRPTIDQRCVHSPHVSAQEFGVGSGARDVAWPVGAVEVRRIPVAE